MPCCRRLCARICLDPSGSSASRAELTTSENDLLSLSIVDSAIVLPSASDQTPSKQANKRRGRQHFCLVVVAGLQVVIQVLRADCLSLPRLVQTGEVVDESDLTMKRGAAF